MITRPLLILFGLVALALPASAATVDAMLSADETSVGQPVGLQLNVQGTTNVSLPSDLGIDGFRSQLTGRSTQVSIINGRMTTSGIYNYTLIPLREGKFQIPPIEFTADGGKIRTPALSLTVNPASASARPVVPSAPPASANAGAPPAPPGDGEGQLAWGELSVPRERIYAGEVVPVVVRFFFNGAVPFRLLRGEPQVSGEGFKFQSFAPPQQSEETVNGVRYNTLTFKTAITAVKSGEMPLPKVALDVVAQVPARGPGGMDDIFSQFFGGQGVPGFFDERELKVETQSRAVKVIAPPAQGRPANFSGAVGEFTVTASATPTQAAMGDPVTLKVDVAGRGNFDAMAEPEIVDRGGWRTYPPTDRFAKTDDIGFTGTKTFEIPMVAQQAQTATPVAEFSYFDPVKEKYVTVRTQPVPVQAAGKPADAATSVTAAPGASPASQPSATPVDDGWIASPVASASWQPLVRQPAFWVANGLAALALLGTILLGVVRRARQGPRAARAVLLRERDRAANDVRGGDLSDDALFDRALAALAAQARLAGRDDAVDLLDELDRQGRDTSALRALLARSDERKFSGGLAVGLDPAERRRLADAVREVCR